VKRSEHFFGRTNQYRLKTGQKLSDLVATNALGASMTRDPNSGSLGNAHPPSITNSVRPRLGPFEAQLGSRHPIVSKLAFHLFEQLLAENPAG
jgi:hypothetical protein